jgi:checkpoint serine/threonine-protein kinase
VNLEAVYPNINDPKEEYSFEELRAKHRGWLDRKWSKEAMPATKSNEATENQGTLVDLDSDVAITEPTEETLSQALREALKLERKTADENNVEDGDHTHDTANMKGNGPDGRSARPRKKKVREIRGETQTSKICTAFSSDAR